MRNVESNQIVTYSYFALSEFRCLVRVHQFVSAKNAFVNTAVAFVLSECFDGLVGENRLGPNHSRRVRAFHLQI